MIKSDTVSLLAVYPSCNSKVQVFSFDSLCHSMYEVLLNNIQDTWVVSLFLKVPSIIMWALSVFRKCAMISAHYGMSNDFDNLIVSLCKFTTLVNSNEVSIVLHKLHILKVLITFIILLFYAILYRLFAGSTCYSIWYFCISHTLGPWLFWLCSRLFPGRQSWGFAQIHANMRTNDWEIYFFQRFRLIKVKNSL